VISTLLPRQREEAGAVNAAKPTQSDSAAEIVVSRHEPSSDATRRCRNPYVACVTPWNCPRNAVIRYFNRLQSLLLSRRAAEVGHLPNLGFKLVNTKYGDLNLSIYTYIRYLNQLNPIKPTQMPSVM
jgi:hypothetical protein